MFAYPLRHPLCTRRQHRLRGVAQWLTDEFRAVGVPQFLTSWSIVRDLHVELHQIPLSPASVLIWHGTSVVLVNNLSVVPNIATAKTGAWTATPDRATTGFLLSRRVTKWQSSQKRVSSRQDWLYT